MKNNWIFITYYIYCTVIVLATGYVVFCLNRSGWWFLMTLVFTQITPTITTKSD